MVTTIITYQRRRFPRLHHSIATASSLVSSGSVVAYGPYRITERGAARAAERRLMRKLRTMTAQL